MSRQVALQLRPRPKESVRGKNAFALISPLHTPASPDAPIPVLSGSGNRLHGSVEADCCGDLMDNGKRLQIPAAKSLALLNAQVVTGESLRKAAASSTGLAELRAISPNISSWSGANKRALVKIFGPAEEETYRASARVEISGRSFASQQARLIRKADSQLGYLRAALVRVAQAAASEATTSQEVPATQAGDSKLAMLDQGSVHQDGAPKAIEPQKPKRSWRELLLNVWTVGVGALVTLTSARLRPRPATTQKVRLRPTVSPCKRAQTTRYMLDAGEQ